METLIETLLGGLMLGALYALFGLGLSLSLGVMKMINIAHGDLIVLGAYLCATVMQLAGVGPFVSLIAVVPLMFVIGYVLQRVLLNRVVGKGTLSPLLLTFGLSIVLQNVLQETFTADTRSLQAGDLSLRGFDIAGVSVGLLPLVSTLISVVIFAGTNWLIGHSHLGRQAARWRTIRDRAPGGGRRSQLLCARHGVRSGRHRACGRHVRHPHAFLSDGGPERLLYSFEAVVLGGLGNVWGTFIGGLIIGVAQLFGAKVSSGLGPFFGHLVFLIALLARPQGLLGKAQR